MCTRRSGSQNIAPHGSEGVRSFALQRQQWLHVCSPVRQVNTSVEVTIALVYPSPLSCFAVHKDTQQWANTSMLSMYGKQFMF